jgi:hypothetical protein
MAFLSVLRIENYKAMWRHLTGEPRLYGLGTAVYIPVLYKAETESGEEFSHLKRSLRSITFQYVRDFEIHGI